MVAGRHTARTSEEIQLWTEHAAAVWDVEVAGDRYLDVLDLHTDERASQDQLDSSRNVLVRSIRTSNGLAKHFSVDEQRSEARVAAALDQMLARGAEADTSKNRDAVLTLRGYYLHDVMPLLERRMEEETRGIDAAVRTMRVESARLRNVGLLVAILLLIVGLVASWSMAARFSHALDGLTRQVRRLASGERAGAGHGEHPEEPDDEIGEVARAFHDMAADLERQRRERYGFLAAVAHDLRNPLSVLKLNTQLVAREPAPLDEARVRHAFAIVGRQVEALNRMTSDLLDAARLEAGELELHRTEHDLREIARATVELYAEATPRHDLRACLPDEPVLIPCDRERIAQVLNNLVSNALKYSPEGSRVEVALVRMVDRVELTVTDEGPGIAPEDREEIFQPFRRLSQTKNGATGSGLGLAIARRLAAAHGGSLAVEGAPGQGSCFRLRLPVLVPSDGAC